jgi:hypothetical protein
MTRDGGPSVVQFQGVAFVSNEVWLVMELMPGGAYLFFLYLRFKVQKPPMLAVIMCFKRVLNRSR